MANNLIDRFLNPVPGQTGNTSASPLSRIEGVARKTRVPVNHLIALAEMSGAQNEDEIVARAASIAEAYAPRLAAGERIKDIVKGEFGDQSAEAFAQRSRDVGRSLYPDRWNAMETQRREAESGVGTVAADIAKTAAGSVVQGVGLAAQGVGWAAEKTGEAQAALINAVPEAIMGQQLIPGDFANPLQGVADFVKDKGQAIKDSASLTGREAAQASTPRGDLTDPSTWDVGEDPTLRGYAMLATDLLGSMAPVVAASLFSGPGAAMGVGGAMSAGDALDTTEDTIDAWANTVAPDGTRLIAKESAAYRRLIASGMSHERAVAQIKNDVGTLAGLTGGILGSAGGLATEKIVAGTIGRAAGGGVIRRALTSGAAGFVEEGSQEAAEGVAQKGSLKVGAETDQSVTEDSFSNFVLGGIGGGVVGAPAGALARPAGREEPAPVPFTQPGPDVPPPSDGPVSPAGTPPAGEAIPSPSPAPTPPPTSSSTSPSLSGPVGAAMTQAQEPLFPGLTKGQTLILDTGGMETMAVVFDSENAFGVTVSDAETGEILEIPREEFLSGATMTPYEPAPPAAPVDGALIRDGVPPIIKEVAPDAVQTAVDPASPVPGPVAEPLVAPQVPAVSPAEPAAEAAPQPQPGAPQPVGAGALDGLTPPLSTTTSPPTPQPAPSSSSPTPPAPPVYYPNRKLDMRYARVEAPVNGLGDVDPMSFGMIALSNAQTGDVIPGIGTVHKVTDKQIQVLAPDGTKRIYPATGDKITGLAREVGDLISGVNHLGADRLGSLLDMAERDPAFGYKGGIPQLFDDPALRGTEPRPTGPGGILKPLAPPSPPPAMEGATDAQPTGGNERPVSGGLAAPEQADLQEGGQGAAAPVPQEGNDAPVEQPPADTGGADGGAGAVGEPEPGAELTEEQASVSVAPVAEDQDTYAPEPPLPPVPARTAKDAAEYWDGLSMATRRFMAENGALDPWEISKKRWNALADSEKVAIANGFLAIKTPKLTPEFEEMWQAVIAETSAATTVAAAAEETDPNPTPAQAEAENYKTGKARWNGLTLSIENKKGTTRSGTDPDGKAWEVTMPAHYGRILRTEGADGDHVDFYMGDDETAPKVLVIDQIDLKTGEFDEHKVMMGFRDGKAARQTYIDAFSDGKGANRIGGAKSMTVDEFKAWLASGETDKPITDALRAKGGRKRMKKIEDFGEKIGGARKDRVERIVDDLRAKRDYASMSLQEAFPEPNYAALIEDGVPAESVALVAALRGMMARDRKPVSDWKVRWWAADVGKLVDLSARLLAGELNAIQGIAELKDMSLDAAGSYQKDQAIPMLAAEISKMPGDMMAEAGRFKILPDTTHWIYKKDPVTGRNVVDRTVKVIGIMLPNASGRSFQHSVATADEVGPWIKARIEQDRKEREAAGPLQRTRKPAELLVYSHIGPTGKGKLFYIGFKVSANDAIDVAGPFEDAQAARKHREENRAELQERAEVLRDGPEERRSTNDPRVGPDWRGGANVTPEDFLKTFGFRGVEFGNWTAAAERQARLNEAYDALMDLAGELGITTQAISLGGKLGLAFGARGKGGKGAAAAHYEQNYVVMNLTRMSGAGTLAHEWFHALDNFLARKDAEKEGAQAATPTGKGAKNRNEFATDRDFGWTGALDREVRDAIKSFAKALKTETAPWFKRSQEADKAKGSTYFATTIELAARAFERVIKDRLASRGIANDFLANINEGGGAYPTTAEARRQGVTKRLNTMLDAIRPLLAVEGGTTVDMPPVNPEMLDDGPQVGFEWNFVAPGERIGTRKIVSRNGNDFVIEVRIPATDGEPEKVATNEFDLDEVETLIDMDAKAMSAEGAMERQAAARAKMEADEQRKKIDAEEEEAARIVNTFLAENVAAGERMTLRGRLLDKMSLRSSGGMWEGAPYMTRAAYAIRLVNDGWTVKKNGSKTYSLMSEHGSFYQSMFGGRENSNEVAFYHSLVARKKALDADAAEPAAPPPPAPAEAPAAQETPSDNAQWARFRAVVTNMFGAKGINGSSEGMIGKADYVVSPVGIRVMRGGEEAVPFIPFKGKTLRQAVQAAHDVARLYAPGVRPLDMSDLPQDAPLTPAEPASNDEVAPPAPAPAPEAAPPAPAPKPAGLANLTDDENAKLAELEALLSGKLRNQLNSGLDPEMVSVAVQIAGLYVKAGYRRFRKVIDTMMDRLGLTLEQAHPYARLAYNQIRDDLDLAGEDVSDMDSSGEVMAEIRKMRLEAAKAPPSQEAGNGDTMSGTTPEEPAGDEQGNPDADIPQPLAGAEPDQVQGAGQDVPADAGNGDGRTGDGGDRGGAVAWPDDRGSLEQGGAAVPQDEDADQGLTEGNGPQDRPAPEPVASELTGENPGNFVITPELGLGTGTDGQKLAANLAAIELVKRLKAENRHATRDEQAVLARYVGWGGLKRAFDPKVAEDTGQWGRAYRFLKKELTADEYYWARESMLNAHFTSAGVIHAMWRAMTHFGFHGGRALEPTIGTGNFLGLQPERAAESTEWHATEIDPLTGQMAAFLYPDAHVMAGTSFQDAPFASGAFDVAIGNPPFGDERIRTGRNKALRGMKIHNYIISKTGDHLRPGGIMAMVVTHRFLDTADPEARDYLARRFRFMGAFRLPNDAFRANAGTDVVTDVIFLQRLKAGEKPDMRAPWLDTEGKITVGGSDIRVNAYYQANPQNILGRSAMDGTMYGSSGEKGEYTVHSDGRNLDAEIDRLLSQDWADMKDALGTREEGLYAHIALETVATIPVGRMILDDEGRVLRRMLDKPDGSPTIVQLTADSAWGDSADEWRATANMLRQVRDMVQNDPFRAAADGKMTAELLRAPMIAGRIAFTQKGTAKSGGSAAQRFIVQVAEALDSESRKALQELPWTTGMMGVEAKVERMTLGEDGLTRLTKMLDLRRQTLALINAEATNSPNIERLRRTLNRSYDAFVADHGFLNAPANAKLLRNDAGQPLGLESKYTDADPVTGKPAAVVKAPILSKRMLFPHAPPTSAASVSDAATISMQERGRIDFAYISNLTGKTVTEIKDELSSGDSPRIFFDPAAEDYVDAETYLSGNVKAKHREALAAGMSKNADHLKQAFPRDKEKAQIVPTIRGQWIPTHIFEEYLTRLGVNRAKVTITEVAGTVNVEGSMGPLTDAGTQFQHPDKTVLDMFRSASRGKPMKVVRREDDREYVDEEATRAVNALTDQMARDFESWAYDDEDRSTAIIRAFNEKLNVIADRAYNGKDFLQPVGANPDIVLRNSQKNAAYRMIQSPNVLAHHVVGAGKTFTAITGIMERKRMGLSKKPLVVVPNHLVGQWMRDFLMLYPGANVLAASAEDFSKDNRAILFSRMVTGDFDAIIIGHSSLGYIENNREDEAAVVRELAQELEAAIEEAKANDPRGQSRAVKDLVKRLKKYNEKLKSILDKKRDDLGFSFSDMGIDHLTVDEAHEFKNLEYQTSGEQLVGMNSPDGSKKAFDLYVKVRGMQRRKGATAFLTGTPISNSLVEVFTFLKYMARDTLKEMGIAHFDAWSAAFVQAETRFEYTAAQQLKERRVMAGLVNMHVLGAIYRGFADIALQDRVNEMYAEQVREENARTGGEKSEKFPIPKIVGGATRLLTAPPTPEQVAFTDYLVARMLAIKENGRNKAYRKIDNALWVLSDARKASIDIRTVDPLATRGENSKVVRVGNEVKRIYDAWNDDLGTQIVFSDQSVPTGSAVANGRRALKRFADIVLGQAAAKAKLKEWADLNQTMTVQYAQLTATLAADMADGKIDADDDMVSGFYEEYPDIEAILLTADVGFSFYDDLRDYLMELGIPRNEIEFIHDHNSADQKTALFQKVNDGRVRVLLGSTPKLGAGTNVQERLVAIHHADAPWKPAEVEQRNGRGIRQGNKLYERDPERFGVEVLAYATEGTSDVVLWTVLERKARAIEGFLNGSVDRVEEEGGDADTFAEFMAQSTGNPVFRLNMQAGKKLDEEEAKTSGTLRARDAARDFLQRYPSRRRGLDADLAALEKAKPGNVSVSVNYSTRTGDLAEFEAVMAEAQREYDAAFTKYQEKKAEAEAAREAAQAEGKPEKDWPSIPAAPPRPHLLSKAVREKSSYARIIFDGLAEMENQRVGAEKVFQIGPEVQVIVSKQHWSGKDSYDYFSGRVAINRGQTTIDHATSSTTDPARATSIASLFMPALINDGIAHRAGLARSDSTSLDERKALADRQATASVDTTARDRQRDLAAFYRAAAEVAEMQEIRRRLARDNRFIAADKKGRTIGDGMAQELPEQPRYTFDFEGEVYEGSGPSTVTSDSAISAIFEAYRKSDGRLAYVQARNAAEKPSFDPPVWEARYVDVLPVGAEEDMPGAIRPSDDAAMVAPAGWGEVEAEPPVTREDLRAIADAVSAEMKASGFDGMVPVNVVRKAISRRAASADAKESQGFYRYPTQAITVAAQSGAGPVGATRHELIHALRDPALWGGRPYGLFTQAEWRELVRAARADKAIREWVEKGYPDLSTDKKSEEMVAELYRRTREKMPSGAGPLDAALRKLRAILDALANALRGRGFVASAAIIDSISTGEMARRRGAKALTRTAPVAPVTTEDGDVAEMRFPFDGRGLKKMPRSEAGLAAEERTVLDAIFGNIPGPSLTDLMGGRSSRYNLLALVPGRPLFDELGKNLPSAQEYLALKDKMDTLRSEWHARTDRVAQVWRKILASNRDANKAMMDLMHDATIAGVDPALPFRAPRKRPGEEASEHEARVQADRTAYAELRPRFDALPVEFKAMFNTVRNTYSELANAMEKAVIDNVRRGMTIGLERAKAERDADLQAVRDDGLTGEDRDKAVDAAHKRFAMKTKTAEWARNAKLSQLRQQFESNRLSGPYFPLMRFGNYFVTIRDEKSGEVVSFSKFETERDQQRFVREQERVAGQVVQHGTMEAPGMARKQVDPQFVADVERIVGDNIADANVMDMIWQTWLQTMPDYSIRKSRIHRKGRKGFDGDAFRAFAHQVFHGSHQLARLTYAMEMGQALEGARKEAAGSSDPNRLGLIVNEMERRHDFTMNPQGSGWATAATSAAFIYYLGLSPAAAAVNLTQTTMIGIPVLAAGFRRGGIGRASRELMRAVADFTSGRGHAAASARLTEEERRAMADAYDSGLIDASQAHDLAGISDSGIEYSALRHRVMAPISYLFHQTERMNREVTFLAAYRMGRANEFDHATAVREASRLTWKTHFDYQNSSRPRLMQNDAAKVLLVFRNYNLNVLWRLFRDLHQVLNGKSAEERREARAQLVGITAMMMFHAGITGTWGYALITTLLGLFAPGGSDDVEDELQRALVEMFGPAGASVLLKGVPGTLTGVDLSNRIGMPELWFRSSDRALEGDDQYNYWLQQMVGAVPGIVENVWRGVQIGYEGNTERGIETAAPKWMRDLMKATRYYDDGVTTINGDEIMDPVGVKDALVQALGFTPAEVAERYAANAKLKNAEQRIIKERSALLAEATGAIRRGTPIDPSTMAEIADFNAANPDYPITSDSILRSLSARIRAANEMEGGIRLNPKLDERLRNEAAPAIN